MAMYIGHAAAGRGKLRRDLDLHDQVTTLAGEPGMPLDREHDIEMARLPAADRVAFAEQPKSLAVFDPSRDGDADAADTGVNAFAAARVARCPELAANAGHATLPDRAVALPYDPRCSAALAAVNHRRA